MADCAKLAFNIGSLRDNINMQWSGFNDSLVNFVSETMQKFSAMRDVECREIFNQVKEKLQMEWANFYLNQVYQLAYTQLDTFLYASDVEKSALKTILDTFDYDQFKSMQA